MADDAALVDAARLWWRDIAGGDEETILGAVHLLAWLHWARATDSPGADEVSEKNTAFAFFHILWQWDPEAVPPMIATFFEESAYPRIENAVEYASGILRGVAASALENSHRRDDADMQDIALALCDMADWESGVTDGYRTAMFRNMASVLIRRMATTEAMSDIDRTLALIDRALAVDGTSSVDSGEWVVMRGVVLWRRFRLSRRLTDLRRAVDGAGSAVAILPDGHPERAGMVEHHDNVTRLLRVYLDHQPAAEGAAYPEVDDIMFVRAALDAAADDERQPILISLGKALVDRYTEFGRADDLDEAVDVHREAAPRAGGDTTAIAALAAVLQIRFESCHVIDDLDECIELYRLAGNQASTPIERVIAAAGLADGLEASFAARADPAELYGAIAVAHAGVLATWPDPTAPVPDAEALPMVEHLAFNNLRRRIRGAQETGDTAFVYADEAMTDAAYLWWLAQRLAATDPASPAVMEARTLLGEFHIVRHNANTAARVPDELAQTLMYWLPAPQVVPDVVSAPLNRMIGPAADPDIQTRYANTLINHSAKRWSPTLLQAATLLLTSAAEASAPNDPELPERLVRLADAYLIRGLLDHRRGDVEVAQRLIAEAVAIARPDHPEAARYRNRLERVRSKRLSFAGRSVTPDPGREMVMSVAILREYVDSAEGQEIAAMLDADLQQRLHESSREPAGTLHSAVYLEEFLCDGLAVSLELALRAAEAEAARLTSPLDRIRHLMHVAEIHRERYRIRRNAAEIAAIARPMEEALALTARIGPHRAPVIAQLADVYEHQWGEEGGEPDEQRFAHLYELARTTVTDALPRLKALRQVGRLGVRYGWLSMARIAYRDAVALMRTVAVEEIDIVDQAARFASLNEVTSEAVTALILAGDPAGALEAAEAGRGVLYSLELDLRTDLSGLRATRPDLAQRFERLRRTITEQRLDAVRGGAGYVRTARAWQRRDAWANLLEEIRAVDGYADFLRPASAAELTSLGLSGPIVLVNASRFGSHALIVDPDGSLQVVPLDRLTIDDVRLRAFDLLAGTLAGEHGSTGTRTALNGTLTWLWDAVVGPVLDHLGRTTGPTPRELLRVWWIPTGLLALLPMHAATNPGGRSAIDLVTSSYAPSVRMLARAAARGAVTRAGGDLVVAVRKATGPELAGAEQEGNALAEQIPDAVVMMNEAATRLGVLAALNRASRAYFACHQVRDDARPHLSGLLLFDDILTVDDLLRVDLADAEFAYLSACATVVPAADAPDEFTHLAAAFQMAGFRSVVATLWPVRDLIATEFSRLFHDGDGTDSATDLAAAARALRGRYPDQPECWAPFLHYGL